MTLMLARLTIALALLPPALIAQDQPPGQPKFLLLATSRTGTMEKELNEAGARGYRFSGTQEGETVYGGSEVIVLMTLDPEGRSFRYILLATSRTGTMQKELNEAPPEYEIAGMTVFKSAFGGNESAVILEAAIGGGERSRPGGSLPEPVEAGGSDLPAPSPSRAEERPVSTPQPEHAKVTKDNVVFLYEARAELRVRDEELAAKGFSEYANARDEFSRHDILQRVKPIIEKRLGEAAATKRVYLDVSTNIGSYDFERRAFPTGVSEGTFIPFHRQTYAVTLANGADLEYVPVAMEAARTLARELQRTRRGVAKIYGEIEGASERTLNYSVKKTLSVQVTRIELLSPSGALVGSKTLASSP